ncbi:ubiquitin-conjugating enzyme E2 M [Pelomyxa schiedti]|nr:ubiquitin-conjugating enzyme E2 M [Pelomyxa schiedti]
MLKLRQMQQQQRQQQAAASASGSTTTTSSSHSTGSATSPPSTSPPAARTGDRARAMAEMRCQKDISEMDRCPGTTITFPDPTNFMHFIVKVKPPEGLYAGGEFIFSVKVPATYPYDPPKVHCDTLIYHPNIDWEGHVCLNILRQDWMPVLSVGAVIFGLLHLFLEPNADDPLNKEAADSMVSRPAEFERNVKATLRGGVFFGRRFNRVLN